MHRLYANNTPFCTKDLSIPGFWYLHKIPGTNLLQILRDDSIHSAPSSSPFSLIL